MATCASAAQAACRCEVGDIGKFGRVYLYLYHNDIIVRTFNYKMNSEDAEPEARARRACEIEVENLTDAGKCD